MFGFVSKVISISFFIETTGKINLKMLIKLNLLKSKCHFDVPSQQISTSISIIL